MSNLDGRTRRVIFVDYNGEKPTSGGLRPVTFDQRYVDQGVESRVRGAMNEKQLYIHEDDRTLSYSSNDWDWGEASTINALVMRAKRPDVTQENSYKLVTSVAGHMR